MFAPQSKGDLFGHEQGALVEELSRKKRTKTAGKYVTVRTKGITAVH